MYDTFFTLLHFSIQLNKYRRVTRQFKQRRLFGFGIFVQRIIGVGVVRGGCDRAVICDKYVFNGHEFCVFAVCYNQTILASGVSWVVFHTVFVYIRQYNPANNGPYRVRIRRGYSSDSSTGVRIISRARDPYRRPLVSCADCERRFVLQSESPYGGNVVK